MPGFLQHIEKKVSKNVNEKNGDKNGDGSGMWQGLATSVPEKLKESFRTGAIAFATIIPKLVEGFKLEANEILKLRQAFCHGELDAWLASDPDASNASQWPAMQGILHAREVAQRAESRAAAREKLRQAEALEAAAAKQSEGIAADGCDGSAPIDSALVQQQKSQANMLLEWLEAREVVQKTVAKLDRDFAELDQQRSEARCLQIMPCCISIASMLEVSGMYVVIGFIAAFAISHARWTQRQ